jgi:hypothetical protein
MIVVWEQEPESRLKPRSGRQRYWEGNLSDPLFERTDPVSFRRRQCGGRMVTVWIRRFSKQLDMGMAEATHVALR